MGADTIQGGPEVTWTQTPTKWSNLFFKNLFENEWELTKSPAGVKQWKAKNGAATIPDAHDESQKHVPTMLTTDLSLKLDPAYATISRRFFEHPDQFADAFARAWFKLTHRDMGPIARYRRPAGSGKETLPWQDPIPAVDHPLIGEADIAALKATTSHRDCRSRSWSRPRGRRHRRSAVPTSVEARTVRESASRRRRTGTSTSRRNSRRSSASSRLSRRSSMPRPRAGREFSLADLIVLGGSAALKRRRRPPAMT